MKDTHSFLSLHEEFNAKKLSCITAESVYEKLTDSQKTFLADFLKNCHNEAKLGYFGYHFIVNGKSETTEGSFEYAFKVIMRSLGFKANIRTGSGRTELEPAVQFSITW